MANLSARRGRCAFRRSLARGTGTRAFVHSVWNITRASTSPCAGCAKAPGRRPTMSKPIACHSLTARLVGGNYEVELHRPKTALASAREGNAPHMVRATPRPRSVRRGDVAAVRHMGAAALLVGAQIIGADNAARLLGDEHLVAGREPVGEAVGLRRCRAAAGRSRRRREHGLDRGPYGRLVCRRGRGGSAWRSLWPENVSGWSCSCFAVLAADAGEAG